MWEGDGGVIVATMGWEGGGVIVQGPDLLTQLRTRKGLLTS